MPFAPRRRSRGPSEPPGSRTRSSGFPRAAVPLLASGLLLALLAPRPAPAQERPREPGGREPGVVPLDPDAPVLLRRAAPDRPDRRFPGRRGSRTFPPFAIFPAWPPPPDRLPPPRPDEGRTADGADGRAAATPTPGAPAADPARPPPERPVRPAPEGPCLEVAVRLAAGGVHRLRVDGGRLDVETPADLVALLRERMAAEGALAVEGLDGASLHLAARRVAGIGAERCPAIRMR